jgi:hypothetical protein
MTEDLQEQVVYVVVATRGEYSDRTEWICGAFLSREEAIQRAEENRLADVETDARNNAWWSAFWRFWENAPPSVDRAMGPGLAALMKAFEASNGPQPTAAEGASPWEFRPDLAVKPILLASALPNIKGPEAGKPIRLLAWQKSPWPTSSASARAAQPPGASARR